MSIEGVAEKTGILLLITATTAIMTALSMPEASALILIGALGGFVVAMIVIFSGSMNPMLICVYAALEGLVLGGITWLFEVYLEMPGIWYPSSTPNLPYTRCNDSHLQGRTHRLGS